MTRTPYPDARATRIENAAQTLAGLYRSGTQGECPPRDQHPADIDEAFAIQQRVTKLLEADIGGWKCSLPGPSKTVLAPLYRPRIVFAQDSLRCIAPVDAGMAEIEPEIAYLIGDDLPSRAAPYSLEEVLTAIRSTHMAFELIGSRYRERANVSFPMLLADRLANDGLFVGPAIDLRPDNVALEAMMLTLEGDGLPREQWWGQHPDGHPLMPLLWVANYLSQQAAGLRRGQVVTTGSYHGVMRVAAGQALRMYFGPLGKLDVTIQAVT